MAERKALKSVLQANGEFSKNLYKILAEQSGNIFFSPISLHAILSLVSQGSENHTKEAFTKVLHVMPDVKTAAEGYKDVMGHLNSIDNVILLMANKIFLHKNYKLQEAFDSVAAEQFLAEVQLLDFEQSKSAAKSINSWVEEKTNNKIKDIVDSQDLDKDTRLVLVNAIYFKGRWATPFSPKNTETEVFYINDTEVVDVEMMHMTDYFYLKNDDDLDAKVLEMPYTNKSMSLVIILPNYRNGITEVEKKLAQRDITKITQNMYELEVKVALPKFKFEETIDLEQPLTKMGLGIMFNRDANFSGIIDSSEPIYVSKVIQKTFIEVNEEGTEAAAATEVEFLLLSGSWSPPPEFIADHPFIIVLHARQEDKINVLFMGRISEPIYE